MELDPHFDALEESQLLISKNVTQHIQDSTLFHDRAIHIYMAI